MTVGSIGVHDKLLAELSGVSVGPRTIPREAAFKSPGSRIENWMPVITGAWRTAMVRSIFVGLLGLLLLVSAPFAASGPVLTTVGWALVVGAIWGVPGGVEWLEVRTRAGFYSKAKASPRSADRNTRLQQAFQGWCPKFPPTPFLRTGELCTAMPFLWSPNRSRSLPYERVWLKAEDEEHFAMDWVFPPSDYDPTRPIVMILTGLAPDTHWTTAGGFIGDAAWHLTANLGMTAIVLVARGTMDTEVKENVFHGARVTDLRQSILAAEKAIGAVAQKGQPAPPIFAAGYSMGAIILGNYCGKYGADARLRGAVHFSGLYDAKKNMEFQYSAQTWQAYLCYGLKSNFFPERIVKEAVKRGVDVPRIFTRAVASVVDIDGAFVAPYNGYKDVIDYYRDMSLYAEGKWKNVKIPLLAVAARDDPITHTDSLRAEELSAGNENLLFLITDQGGHVGWPTGMQPWKGGFNFMSDGIGLFVETLALKV